MKEMRLRMAAYLAALTFFVSGCAGEEASSSSMPQDSSSQETEESASQESAQEEEATTYPKGKMFVCRDRLDYRDGDLVLRVERLDLEAEIVGEFDEETVEKLSGRTMTKEEQTAFFSTSTGDELLKKGIVLLNNASLPGNNTNSNVSLSGHRDIYGKEFLHIDELTEGDLLYLTYGGVEYEYTYEETTIHAPDDWSITYCGSEPMLTLISCDPVGTSLHRIVAKARLTASRPAESPAEDGT